MSNTVLVTGAAGFIGSHTVDLLLARGDRVIGVDCLDAYYDPALKRRNLEEVRAGMPAGAFFELAEVDVRDSAALLALFAKHTPDSVLHLAALAGVRASIDQAVLYFDVNLTGTINLLEAARHHGKPNFVFASTSSVYGNTDIIPFVETDRCDRPLSPYPASKRSAELVGHSYHNLFGMNFTALRFFTVYGPRNRPDMMAGKLLHSITTGAEIPIYNDGHMRRDWTYVVDTASGVVAASDRRLGYEVINLGRGEPVQLSDFISEVESRAGAKATLRSEPTPQADVLQTFANIDKAKRLLDYSPTTSVPDGVAGLWAWYDGLS